MPNESEKKSYVEAISLAGDLENRLALASIRVGDVLIRGVAIWRTRHGRLRVYFPSYRLGSGWDEAIYLPEELRTEVEADVISAYKASKTQVENPAQDHKGEGRHAR